MIHNKEVTNRVSEAGAQETGATTVLVMGANELCAYLTKALGGQVNIAAVEGLNEGNEAIEKLKPKLLICAMDGERWETIPLIHNARQHQTPILAVAYNQEAIASVDSIEWAVDRKRIDAVIASVKKLLDDPTFVPDDLKRYPPPPPKAHNSADNAEVEPILENADTPPACQNTVSTIAPKSDAAVFEIVEQLNMRIVAEAVKSIGDRVKSLEALVHDLDHLRESGEKELVEQLKTRDERFAAVEVKLESVAKRVEEQERLSDHLFQSVGNRVALVESQLGALVQTFPIVEVKLESVAKRVEEQERLSDHLFQSVGNRVALVESQLGALVQTFPTVEANLENVAKRVEEQERLSVHLSQSVGNRVALVESQLGALVQTFPTVEAKLESMAKRVEEQKRLSVHLSQSVGNRVALVESQLGPLVQTFDETKQVLNNGREAAENRLEKLELAVDSLQSSDVLMRELGVVLAQLNDLGLTQIELDDRIDFIEKRLISFEKTAKKPDANSDQRIDRQIDAIRRVQERLAQRIDAIELSPQMRAAVSPESEPRHPARPSTVPLAMPQPSSPPPPATTMRTSTPPPATSAVSATPPGDTPSNASEAGSAPSKPKSPN